MIKDARGPDTQEWAEKTSVSFSSLIGIFPVFVIFIGTALGAAFLIIFAVLIGTALGAAFLIIFAVLIGTAFGAAFLIIFPVLTGACGSREILL